MTAIPNTLFGNGLIDRTIECTLATKEQIVSLFNQFFPTSHGIPHSTAQGFNNLKVPLLSDLAEEFAREIPEYSFSLTELQQYLIPHKSSPAAAVAGIGKWADARLDERFARNYPACNLYNPPPPWMPQSYPYDPRSRTPNPYVPQRRTPSLYYPRSRTPQWTPPLPSGRPLYNPPQRFPRPMTPPGGGWGASPPPVLYSPASSPPLSPRPVHPVTASPPSPRAPFTPGVTSRTPSPPPSPPPLPSGGWPYYSAVNDGRRSPVSPRFTYTRAYTPTLPSARNSPAPIDVNSDSHRNMEESAQSISRSDD